MAEKLFQARLDILSVIELTSTEWEIGADVVDVSGSFTALDIEVGDKVFITGVASNHITVYDRYKVDSIIGRDTVYANFVISYDEDGTPKTYSGIPLTGPHLIGRAYGVDGKLMEMPSSHEILDEFRKDQGMVNMNLKEITANLGVANFLDLTDVVPSTYVGHANAIPSVHPGETGLDFTETKVAELTDNEDFISSYTGYSLKPLRVRLDELGVEPYTPDGSDEIDPIFLGVTNDVKGLTGWLDNDNITVSYNYINRTITLTHPTHLYYYWRGVKKELGTAGSWTSTAHTNTTGAWFLATSDGTNFVWSNSLWVFTEAMVAYVNRGATAALSFAIREVHGIMDSDSHEETHDTIGTYRLSGGILTAGTYTPDTASDVATTPGFDASVLKDEDLKTTVPAWIEGTYTTMYVGGANTSVFNVTSSFPFLASGSYIQINDVVAGAMADGINNRYYNVYQILMPCASDTDSQNYRMIMLQPQAAFVSLASAIAEDPRGLNLGQLASLSPEFNIHARITYVTLAGNANTGKCRIATGGVTYVTGPKSAPVTITGALPPTPLDNFLDWDTDHYQPYLEKRASALYYGTQNPDAVTRLNWVGNFHANIFGLGDAGVASKYYGTDANKMLVAMADPLPLTVKQELELNDTWKLGSNLYVENVFTGSDLTQVNYWSSAAKTLKLFTKDITYTGGNPTSIILKDEIANKYLTTTIAYSGSEVLNVTKVVS